MKVEHLVLPVGGNPLPNVVVSDYLICDRGPITLLSLLQSA